MTDEERAKEYAEKECKNCSCRCDRPNVFKRLSNKKECHAYFRSYEGFLAGLKAGRPQWHDLRKAPNDLPKGQINRYLFGYVKNYGGKKPMLIKYNGKWFYDANTYNEEVKVIAWCEIPQFKESE